MKHTEIHISSFDELKRLQEHFSEIISSPLNGNVIQFSDKGKDWTTTHIQPNSFLTSEERIEIYNQQYWYRLLDVMQSEFPVLRHLLGIQEFNELAEDYLNHYPSESPSLNNLTVKFLDFLEENYERGQHPIYFQAAEYECGRIRAFWEKEFPPLRPEKLTEEEQLNLADLAITLQPHVFLFKFTHHFSDYRARVEFDDEEVVFPELEEKTHVMVLSRKENQLVEKDVSELEFQLLSTLKKPASIAQLMAMFQSQLNRIDELEIQQWFRSWVQNGWLYLP